MKEVRVSRAISVTNIKDGDPGDAAVSHRLLPNQTSIRVAVAADGTCTPATLSATPLQCGFVKAVGGEVETVANVDAPPTTTDTSLMVDGRYNLYFRRRTKSNAKWQTTFYKYRRTTAVTNYLGSTLQTGTYDAVEFVLCTNTGSTATEAGLTGVADRVTVPLLYDGAGTEAQYAPSGDPADEQVHSTWQEGDTHMRTRSGGSWSAWMRIVGPQGEPGEPGNGIQVSSVDFALSKQGTTATVSTAPAITGSWEKTPPTPTHEWPYLWRREFELWDDGTTVYRYVAMARAALMGRNPWYAGDWDEAVANAMEVEVTDHQTPYFSKVIDGTTYYVVFVGENGVLECATVTDFAEEPDWEHFSTQFKYIITEAMFTQFAKLGAAIFNGDFQFSQYGYMLGFQDERTEIADSSQYQNIDPDDVFGQTFEEQGGTAYELEQGDMFPFAKTSSSGDVYATGAAYVDVNSITGDAGTPGTVAAKRHYSLRMRAKGRFLWQVRAAQGARMPASLTSGTVDSADAEVEVVRNFFSSSAGACQLAVQGTDETESYVSFAYIRPCKFVPNLAFNMLTGDGLMNRLFLRGGFTRGVFDVTPSNYTRFLITRFGGSFLSLVKMCGSLRFTSAWNSNANIGVAIPQVWCPDFPELTESEKNDVRGLAGQTLHLYNDTTRNITITGQTRSKYSDVGNSFAIPAGTHVLIEVDYHLKETRESVPGTEFKRVTFGDEEVLWRMTWSGMQENIF